MSIPPKYESFTRTNFPTTNHSEPIDPAKCTSSESSNHLNQNGSKNATIGSDSGRYSNSTIASDDQRLGFGTYTDGVHRKAVKKGFNFTIMVIGESGLGKSTFINSLFGQELYKDRETRTASQKISRTTKIEKRQIELDERGVKIRLTIIDTPGFNDAIDSTDCWKPIEEYIDSTFEQYFKDECGLNRKNIQDNRIHCCLYFVSPYGRGLGQLDTHVIKCLQTKVNIVPVIAKADAFTQNELKQFKARLMSCIDTEDLKTYRLPECDSDEEEEIKKLDKEIKAVLPFAIIGSTSKVENEGMKRQRGRQYAWGTVEVENGNHCDFSKLRTFLLKTHMQDLKDMTLEVHYENYRAQYITDRMSKRHNAANLSTANSKFNRHLEKSPYTAQSRFNQDHEMTTSQVNVNNNLDKNFRLNGSIHKVNEANNDTVSLLNSNNTNDTITSSSSPMIRRQSKDLTPSFPSLTNSVRTIVAGN